MAFIAYANNQNGESCSPWDGRFQCVKEIVVGTISTATDLTGVTPDTTELLSDFITLDKFEVLEVCVIYSTATGVLTTPAQFSMWFKGPGTATPVQMLTADSRLTTAQQTTAASLRGVIKSSQAINTVDCISLAFTNASPSVTDGTYIYPQSTAGARIRLLFTVAGVGAQSCQFKVRYRERPPVATNTVTIPTLTATLPLP